MESHVKTTCGARSGEPGSREAGLLALEQLSVSCEQRRILNALFQLVWPSAASIDFRPATWDIAIKVDALGKLINLGRTATKDHLDPLVKCGLISRTEKPGRPSTLAINWSKIYEVREPTRRPPEASAVPSPEVEASGGLHHEAEGSEASDEVNPIEVAILRVGNHIANVIRTAFAEMTQELAGAIAKLNSVPDQQPVQRTEPIETAEGVEASGGLHPKAEGSEASNPSGGLHSRELINNSINQINSLIHLIPEIVSGGLRKQAEGSEASGGVAGFRWSPRLFRAMNAKSLKDPDFVEECFQFVVSTGRFRNDAEDRVRFVALLIDSVKIKPKEPGGVWTIKIRDGIDATPEGIDQARKTLAFLANQRASQQARASPRTDLERTQATVKANLVASGFRVAPLPMPDQLSAVLMQASGQEISS